jgi:hypothetical protein
MEQKFTSLVIVMIAFIAIQCHHKVTTDEINN